MSQQAKNVDLLVVGSGAAGLSAAVTARLLGLRTLLVESTPWLGGSTAVSGGVIWVPGNPFRAASPTPDTATDALAYIAAESGNFFDHDAAQSYVEIAPTAMRFLNRHAGLEFTGPDFWPDYHQHLPGAREGGRSMRVEDFDGRLLGSSLSLVRPPLASMTLFGGMMVSGNDLRHLLKARRSPRSLLHVLKILLRHVRDRLGHPRGTRLANGNALVGRLLRRYLDLEGDLAVSSPLLELTQEGQRVTGGWIDRAGVKSLVNARLGVVLAAGGFPHDDALRMQVDSAYAEGLGSRTLAPAGNRGDGVREAMRSGGSFNTRQVDSAAWVPVSELHGAQNGPQRFPHFFDRSKPGFIMVDPQGMRFVNEASSYHDIGREMHRLRLPRAFILCDHKAIKKYGVGMVPPVPLLFKHWIKAKYLKRGHSLIDLANQLGVDAQQLSATVKAYNSDASQGSDPLFNKGHSSYERYIGDQDEEGNPCIAPLDRPPYYAVEVVLGDIGTFGGLTTNASGQVLNDQGHTIDGLYAAGNDRASIFGGTYPAAGITLGPALVFGYLAAVTAAQLSTSQATQLAQYHAREQR
jgi:succinate dehydrogenase/fumarate reductase flavoprotein subunit